MNLTTSVISANISRGSRGVSSQKKKVLRSAPGSTESCVTLDKFVNLSVCSGLWEDGREPPLFT